MSPGFAAGEQRWAERLGTLRNVVRQELVTRQLRAEVPEPPARVLDVGCGQGTQALALARRGFAVTGLDSSTELLERFRAAVHAEPAEVSARVQLVHADLARLPELFPAHRFDVVLCHGVLMYVADPEPVIAALAGAVAPSGMVSLLVRNGDALAMRPGLLGDWATARAAFDTPSYLNRLGVAARADRLDDLDAALAASGLDVTTWYGVRIFTDIVASEADGAGELDDVLDVEERAGRTDPYRRVAGLLHVIARRR